MERGQPEDQAQPGLSKGRSCLNSLNSFYAQVTTLEHEGKAVGCCVCVQAKSGQMSGPALGSRQPPAALGWAEGLEGSRRGPGVLVTEAEHEPRCAQHGQKSQGHLGSHCRFRYVYVSGT